MKTVGRLAFVFTVGIASALALIAIAGCDDDDGPFPDDALKLDWPSSDPNRYHWDGLRDPFFEVWNWRLFVPEMGEAMTLSLGVANPGSDDPDARGAFALASGGGRGEPVIELSSLRAFEAGRQVADVTVESNRGTETVLRGAIGGDEPTSFDLTLTIDRNWDDAFGLLTNLPGIPFNWVVGGLSARASGWVSVGDRDYELVDAPVIEDHAWGDEIPGASYALFARGFGRTDSALAFIGGELPIGPFELPIIMLAVYHEGVLYEFRSQDLNLGGLIQQEDDNKLHIQATRGDVRVAVDVLNVRDEPVPALFVDGAGVGFAGRTWHGASVDVELQRYVEGPGWTREFRLQGGLAQMTQTDPDLYQGD